MANIYLNPSEYVVHFFGGVRAAARRVGRSPSSVCAWRKVGTVPLVAIHEILALAKRRKLDIKLEDLCYGRTIKTNGK